MKIKRSLVKMTGDGSDAMEQFLNSTPPELQKAAEEATKNLVSQKSK